LNSKNLIVTLVSLALFAGCQPRGPEPADLVLDNAWVYTVDSSRSVAEAVAVRDDTIVFVGSSADVAAYVGDNTEVRDMDGAMLMPGIHDMHIHTFGVVEPKSCDLGSTGYSLEDLVPVLKQCIVDYDIAEGDWLVVTQWAFSDGNQPSGELPHIRAALDAVSTEHPIFLYGNDGHHGAANSMALALATNDAGEPVEINAESLETDYADYKPMIAVDASGEPTGGVNEGARLLIRSNWYADMLGMSGDLDDALSRANRELARSGITTLQDAIVSPDSLAAYGRLEERGEMSFRLRAAMEEPGSEDIEAIDAHLAKLSDLREQYKDYEYVSADGVKLFADAVLEGNPMTLPPTLPVAAVLNGFKQPIFGGSIEDGTFDVVGYVDQDREACRTVQMSPDAFSARDRVDAFVTEYGFYPQQCIPQSGVLEHEETYIQNYVRKTTEAGFHVHIHALSDKGVRVAVDALGAVKDIADRLGTTQSLSHVQLAHPDDQARIGDLGISVAFTFAWAVPGVEYNMMVIPFIEEVAGIDDLFNPDTYYMQNVYPAKAIQDAGGILVHGSDAPVDTRDPRPFVNLQASITREFDGRTLNADQRIDIHSAIEAFTVNGARLMGHDDRVGSLEVGKKADIIALSQNIVELAESGDPGRIAATEVTLTVFDGRVVHEAGTN
jgi:predicted amidohydrolase YtcJ